MIGTSPCRICGSGYTALLQEVVGRRTRSRFPQYVCLDCRSFFHTSGYRETDERKKLDFDALYDWREMHTKLQSQLFLELKTKVPHVRTVCEVGHGIGLFLRAARDFQVDHYGFEVNAWCHNFARNELGLNVELGLFDRSHRGRYDLICSIMVFEHLENPRSLFDTMRSKLNPDGAIYLCVPFVERSDWPFLLTASTDPAPAPPDPFYDNDVHITHYSVEGMCKMGLSLGARTAEYFVSKDVAHFSPGAYQGVLFRF